MRRHVLLEVNLALGCVDVALAYLVAWFLVATHAQLLTLINTLVS